jgi:SAM-dependent methyltransferase
LASIVDLACGGGRLLYFFKQSGFKNISGVDISPAQIRLASQVVPNVYGANILEWLHKNTACYDLIIGLDIIEHLHKTEVFDILDLCHSALKPGGRLILQTVNCESPWGNIILYGDFSHEVGFTHNSLSRLLKITGFKDVESREIGPVPINYSFLSSCRYILWQFFRIGMKVWNLVETGSSGSGIFTRIFIISAINKLFRLLSSLWYFTFITLLSCSSFLKPGIYSRLSIPACMCYWCRHCILSGCSTRQQKDIMSFRITSRLIFLFFFIWRFFSPVFFSYKNPSPTLE